MLCSGRCAIAIAQIAQMCCIVAETCGTHIRFLFLTGSPFLDAAGGTDHLSLDRVLAVADGAQAAAQGAVRLNRDWLNGPCMPAAGVRSDNK